MRLVVARVGRPHGIRGEVTIEVRTDVPEDRFVPGTSLHVATPGGSRAGRRSAAPVRAPGLPDALSVTGVRDHNGTLLLTFAEVTDRSGAELLRGVLLEADVAERSDEPDAWYDHELVGLRVEDLSGRVLGEVAALEHVSAQDLLVVRRPDGEQRLVPFVTAIVPVVDVAGGRVVVDPPGGLITDLEDGDA
jgi:16S rRNA processing protein RimM